MIDNKTKIIANHMEKFWSKTLKLELVRINEGATNKKTPTIYIITINLLLKKSKILFFD